MKQFDSGNEEECKRLMTISGILSMTAIIAILISIICVVVLAFAIVFAIIV